MTDRSLSNYISMHHDPITLDLDAKEVRTHPVTRLLKQCDTLMLRIAVPPLVIWFALYSLTELFM
jgi:hypothetical protein